MSLIKTRRAAAPVCIVTLICFLATMLPPSRASAQSVPYPMTGTPFASGAGGIGTLGGPPAPANTPEALATVDLATGAATASFPFELLTARGQAQPALGLTYNSNRGDGFAGVGWTLNLPSIVRKGASGLPQFLDNPTSPWATLPPDDYLIDGQKLVPICLIGSTSCPSPGDGDQTEVMPTWLIVATGSVNPAAGWTYFRRQIDDGNRYFFSPDHRQWIQQMKSGNTRQFGDVTIGTSNITTVAYEQTDSTTANLGASGGKANQIYRWNLGAETDASGNSVAYVWSTSPTSAGMSITLNGVSYLTDIYDTLHVVPSYSYAHHVHLSWTNKWSLLGATMPVSFTSPIWRALPSLALTGVDLTSAPTNSGTVLEQIRRFHLKYSANTLGTRLSLQNITLEGRCPASSNADELADGTLANKNCPSLSLATYGYTPDVAIPKGVPSVTQVSQATLQTLTGLSSPSAAAWEPGNTAHAFVDVNGDARADLLGGSVNADHIPLGWWDEGSNPNGWAAAPWKINANLSPPTGSALTMDVPILHWGTTFAGEQPDWMEPGSPHVVYGDWNSSGVTDWLLVDHGPVSSTPAYSAWTPAPGALGGLYPAAGGAYPTFSGGGPVPQGASWLNAQNAVDVDGDGLVDLALVGSNKNQTFLTTRDRNGNTWPFNRTLLAATQSVFTSTMSPPYQTSQVMADMNGDGIPDVVLAYPSPIDNRVIMDVFSGKGNGLFSSPYTLQTPGLYVGVFAGNQPVLNGAASHGPGVSALRLGDLNGDGLADYVLFTQTATSVSGGLSMTGSATVCLRTLNTTNTDFACSSAITTKQVGGDYTIPTVSNPVPLGSEMVLDIADVDGSGLPRFVWTHMAGYFDVRADVTANPFLWPSGGASTLTTFQVTSARPNLLQTVTALGGLQTTLTYQYINSLSVGGVVPVPVWVVTGSTTTNQLTGSQARSVSTGYGYSGPQYDARHHTFIGFQTVTVNAAGLTTTTHYATTSCTSQSFPLTGCFGDDAPYVAMERLPTYVERFDVIGNSLTTSLNKYQWQTLYKGTDGNVVLSSTLSQTLQYAWYSSSTMTTTGYALYWSPSGGTSGQVGFSVSLNVPSTPPIVHQYEYDAFGNLTSTVDFGQQGVDIAIETDYNNWSLPPGDTTGWSYRPTSKVVSGQGTGSSRQIGYTWNSWGSLQYVTGYPGATLPLPRATGMPGPPNVSSGNAVILRALSYDGWGNLTSVLRPNGRCTSVSFDATFEQVPTASYAGTWSGAWPQGGCNGLMATAVTIDRGFERPVSRGVPSSSLALSLAHPTSMRYDAFGRIVEVDQPDPTMSAIDPNAALTGPASGVQYNDTGLVRSIHYQTVDGTYASPQYVDHYRYLDGFGDMIAAVDGAGPASATGNNAQWTVSGVHTRASNGVIKTVFQPFSITGSLSTFAPDTYPYTRPTQQFTYDGLRRPTSITDPLGHFTLIGYNPGVSGTALTVTVQDPEQNPTNQPNPSPSNLHHPNSYTQISYDGHGRNTLTSAILNSIAPGASTVTTTRSYLPTGELSAISQTNPGGIVATYARSVAYDGLGRMVQNAEPNVGVWTYAYDDNGDLVGTSDGRTCGENIYYDTLGRRSAEDYIPCLGSVPGGYTPITFDGNGNPTAGAETAYSYDSYGRLSSVSDRAQASLYGYDNRDRVIEIVKAIMTPAGTYGSLFYKSFTAYSEADRLLQASTGADATGLVSNVTATYTLEGALSSVGSTFGTLLASQTVDAMGRVLSQTFGDIAQTTATMGYDSNGRLAGYALQRSKQGPWATSYTSGGLSSGPNSPDTLQGVLAGVALGYDMVGNPVSATQSATGPWSWPTASGTMSLPGVDPNWPPGALPVMSRNFTYWDDYRLEQATNQYYPENGNGGTDLFIPPYGAPPDGTLYQPPNGRLTRVKQQNYSYDGRGNATLSTDDVSDYFDRSIGTAVVGTSTTVNGITITGPPDQLLSAGDSGQSGSYSPGGVAVAYDNGGNMTRVTVKPQATPYPYLYYYYWDELGRLSRARRAYKGVTQASENYSYDATGQRVTSAGLNGTTVNIFDSLVLKNAGIDSNGDYVHDATTTQVYLNAAGSTFGHAFVDPGYNTANALPSAANSGIHVFMALGDPLGSTSFVIDHDTSELVEAVTYLPYGGVESDYRPVRWNYTREDIRYTGHWDDAEVGLVYMNARYYSPNLGRFISPDPLTIHGVAGDLNPYEYAMGSPFRYTDPSGLKIDDYFGPSKDAGRVAAGAAANLEGGTPATSGADMTAALAGQTAGQAAYDAANEANAMGGGTPSLMSGSFGEEPSAGPMPFGGGGAPLGFPPIARGPNAAPQQKTARTVLEGTAEGIVAGVVAVGLVVCIDAALGLAAKAAEASASRSAAQILTETFGKTAGRATPGTPFQRSLDVLKQIYDGTYKPPADLTLQHLDYYEQVAKDIINAGQDASGIQAVRLQIVTLLRDLIQ